jgi:hypothetical protein
LDIPGESTDNCGGSGYGFVTFATQTAASECVRTSMHDIRGRRVEVKHAIARSSIAPGTRVYHSTDPIRQRTLFVGNLAWDVSEQQLRFAFGQFGEIKTIQIRQKFRKILDEHGQRLHAAPNIAHIEFASVDFAERVVTAATAANAMNGVRSLVHITKTAQSDSM